MVLKLIRQQSLETAAASSLITDSVRSNRHKGIIMKQPEQKEQLLSLTELRRLKRPKHFEELRKRRHFVHQKFWRKTTKPSYMTKDEHNTI